MNRLNINDATKEELITVVKQLRDQLQKNQARNELVRGMEKEIFQMKKDLQEKDSALGALTHQSAMLSEKSARDEETISVLIKQMEEFSLANATTNDVVFPRGMDTNAVTQAHHPSRKDLGSCVGFALGSVQETSVCEGVSDGAVAIARKNEEIAMLEAKLRELTEVNTFYAAIVTHNDEEERARGVVKHFSSLEESKPSVSIDPAAMQNRILGLESERDELKRILHREKDEKRILTRELHDLREELSSLELDLVVAERWRVDRGAALCATLGSSSLCGPNTSVVECEELSSPRKLAQSVAPIQYRGRGGGLMSSSSNRVWSRSVNPAAETYTSPGGSVINLVDLEGLPEIRLNNPSKEEKMLLERLELYRKHINQMQAYEVDRRRSFDEIERARAELFTEMNGRLEVQRREIQRLNKRTAASNGLSVHGNMKDAATSPLVHDVEPLNTDTRSFESLSLSAAVGPTLTTEEAFLMADLTGKVWEHGNNEACEEAQKEKEFSAQASTSPENASVGEQGGSICDKKYDVVADGAFLRTDEEESAGPDVARTSEIGMSLFEPPPNWVWQLLEMSEERARRTITSEELEKVVEILSWSHMVIAAAGTMSGEKSADATTKAEDHKSVFMEVQPVVPPPSEQEQELVSKPARLQKEVVASMIQGKNENVECEETPFASWEARFSTLLRTLSVQEPWKPMRFLCEAYGEVVDAHAALLGAISISEAAAPSSNEHQRVESVLDALIANDANISFGNSSPERGKNVAERGCQTSVPLPDLPPQTPAPRSVCRTSYHTLETAGDGASNPLIGSSAVTRERESKIGTTTSNTPIAPFFEGHHEPIANIEAPRRGMHTWQWSVSDPLGSLKESQRMDEGKNCHSHPGNGAFAGDTVYDIFTAILSPHPQSHYPDQEAESQEFIAEFDPFA